MPCHAPYLLCAHHAVCLSVAAVGTRSAGYIHCFFPGACSLEDLDTVREIRSGCFGHVRLVEDAKTGQVGTPQVTGLLILVARGFLNDVLNPVTMCYSGYAVIV